MFFEGIDAIAAPLYTGVIAIAYAAAALIVMHLSAQGEKTPVYETRRSMQLLEAARLEADKLHERDTIKPPVRTGVVCTHSAWEIQCWADRFGTTPDALKVAVQRVGPMAADIRRYLEDGPRRQARGVPSRLADCVWFELPADTVSAMAASARWPSPSASAARPRSTP